MLTPGRATWQELSPLFQVLSPPFHHSPNPKYWTAFLKSQRMLKTNLKWILFSCFEQAVVLLNKHFDAYLDCWLVGFYILKKRENEHSLDKTTTKKHSSSFLTHCLGSAKAFLESSLAININGYNLRLKRCTDKL